MQAQWTIQLDTHLYSCFNTSLLICEEDNARYATDEEQIDFLNRLIQIDLEELKDAYLIERLDIFREHLMALNFTPEFFHCWNEVAPNSYTEYLKIEHQENKKIVACFKVNTTQGIKNQEIIDLVGEIESISVTKYEIAKDSKIGSIKLQLLDLGIHELKA